MAQKTSGKIAPHKKSLLARIWQARIAYLLLAPLLIGLIVTAYYPPISGLYHSLFDWNANGREVFIGLDNFKELFQDPVFLNSIPTLFKLMIPRLLISVIGTADRGRADFWGTQQALAVQLPGDGAAADGGAGPCLYAAVAENLRPAERPALDDSAWAGPDRTGSDRQLARRSEAGYPGAHLHGLPVDRRHGGAHLHVRADEHQRRGYRGEHP